MRSLLEYAGGEVERCGFILKTGHVIEVKNEAVLPADSFMMPALDIIKYAPDAFATWHTHPKTVSRLSGADYLTFLNWPHLRHYIVGTDGIKAYVVTDGSVFEYTDDGA
jgi:proteasome lid subunit RPN8/RPN11